MNSLAYAAAAAAQLSADAADPASVAWQPFMAAYACGQWDPLRPPPQPRPSRSSPPSLPPVRPSRPSSFSTTPSLTAASSSSASTSPPIPPKRALSKRRDAASPDYIDIPRPDPLHHSRTISASPIHHARDAATMRWAGSGVDVTPLVIPSPEYELTDPLRNVHAGIPGTDSFLFAASKSNVEDGSDVTERAPRKRLGSFWEGAQDVNENPTLPSLPPSHSFDYPDDPSPLAPGSSPTDFAGPWFTPYTEMPGQSDDASDDPVEEDYFSNRHRSTSSLADKGKSREDGRKTSSGPCSPRSVASDPGTYPLRPYPFDSQASSRSQPTAKPSGTAGLSSDFCINPYFDNFTPAERLQPIPEEINFYQTGFLAPPEPPDEMERRKALFRYNILHTGKDSNFDRIVHLCKLVFNVRIVTITLIGADDPWFKAECGLGDAKPPRTTSLCAHAILQRGDEPMVILDTHLDWRFARHPFVVEEPHMRFWAGAPLRTPDGYNIGNLCLLDDQPRAQFTPRERHSLREFAAIVMREMELWRDKIQLRMRERIQTSMDKFTRETLEVDPPEDGHGHSIKMEKVFKRAASLVRRTLDVEGSVVMDVSHFEMIETPSPGGGSTVTYHGDLFEGASSHARNLSGVNTPSVNPPPYTHFGPIPPPPVLGVDGPFSPPLTRNQPLTGEEHGALSTFLRECPDGKIYERTIPSCFRRFVPSNFEIAIIVPIFNVDKHPFALLCAYTTEHSKRFIEGYELQYLRAIGVVILGSVLKQRMMLADKAKSLFISNISHELRTPLHGILAAAELLSSTNLTSTQASYLKTVQACGTSLAETVNHVLDFTKLSGSMKNGGLENSIRPSKVDLVQLLEETVDGCWIGSRNRAPSEIGSVYAPQGGANPEAIMSPDVPRHVETILNIGYRRKGWVLNCEKGGIRRILMNLIGNSLKFTTDGYVQITLQELPHEDGSTKVPIELTVKDTGKGISKEFLKNQLFQPFSQESSLQPGTGLGLAIVNGIVRSNSVRGKVEVSSDEGVGTEIRVTLEAEPYSPNPESLSAQCLRPLDPVTVTLIGFRKEIRGYRQLQEVVTYYLVQWWGLTVNVDASDLCGVLILNEDVALLEDLVARDDTTHPVIVLSSARSDPRPLNATEAYERTGGLCRIVYKPCGPSAIHSALQMFHQQRFGATPLSAGSSPLISGSLSLKEKRHSISLVAREESQEDVSQTILIGDGGSVILKSSVGAITSKRNLRVLVVEDNRVNRALLTRWLSLKGYEFVEAENGQEGVDVFGAYPSGYFDIVLIDMSMPVLDGLGATTKIRAIEALRRAETTGAASTSPTLERSHRSMVVALTGLAAADDKRRAFAVGMDGYMVKPVLFGMLTDLFQKLTAHEARK
ncbi:hypothetical protein BOTBODRAFT_130731 [Botryobasidium botryosum FD-172 SS1]|uniref:histidine kinase n=1 Tax=Botryobasidium botryosum (strain FD-172 SS1) TaxID=930990 RepID=A0A067MKB2_BOTB1|nr:hypothetical protein BOTBODRAFT_130731 [Botryobasidium botryosum FD-172 SS1]